MFRTDKVAKPDPHVLGIWIRICTRVKSWIWICIKVEIQEFLEAQNGALEAHGCSKWRRGGLKWSPEGYVDPNVADRITLMKSRIRIRINMKRWSPISIKIESWIRISIKS
jgi:hypothetical protein